MFFKTSKAALAEIHIMQESVLSDDAGDDWSGLDVGISADPAAPGIEVLAGREAITLRLIHLAMDCCEDRATERSLERLAAAIERSMS